jgi:hypothetical protein
MKKILLLALGLLGWMPVQAAVNVSVDPYSLAPVQAACGARDGAADVSAGGDPAVGPAGGLARIYVFTAQRGSVPSHGGSVRVGVDGRWVGTNESYTYTYVDVPAGMHHLCVGSEVKKFLPGTSSAVALARVEVFAGKSYFFTNRRLNLLGWRVFDLQPLDEDQGAMYLETTPWSGGRAKAKQSDVAKTAAVVAACGPDPYKGSPEPVRAGTPPGPPEAGKALLYLYTEDVPVRGSFGFEVRLGMDGRWVGAAPLAGYMAVEIDPGLHHLCTAIHGFLGGKSIVWVGRLEAKAGETYFVNSRTLAQDENALPVFWLKAVAGMPKSDDTTHFGPWTKADFPYPASELQSCGVPPKGSTAPDAVQQPDGTDVSQTKLVLFFMPGSGLSRRPLNTGVDGKWASSIRGQSWQAIRLTAGVHRVCLRVDPQTGLFADDPPGGELKVLSIAAERGEPTFVRSVLTPETESTATTLTAERIDPDEGAMLMLLYPEAQP